MISPSRQVLLTSINTASNCPSTQNAAVDHSPCLELLQSINLDGTSQSPELVLDGIKADDFGELDFYGIAGEDEGIFDLFYFVLFGPFRKDLQWKEKFIQYLPR